MCAEQKKLELRNEVNALALAKQALKPSRVINTVRLPPLVVPTFTVERARSSSRILASEKVPTLSNRRKSAWFVKTLCEQNVSLKGE